MIELLKWTSTAWLGVIASTFLFILAVIFAVQAAPAAMPPWHIAALVGVTLYLWLFGLVAVGRLMLALRPLGRQPVAMS